METRSLAPARQHHERERPASSGAIRTGSSGRAAATPPAATCACGGQCPRCRRASALAVAGARSVRLPSSQAPAHVLARATREEAGRPLPEALADDWEARLGRDLSALRIHAGGDVGRAVASTGAAGVNFGRHLFFAAGQGPDQGAEGHTLLGHETAHALQTRSGERARGHEAVRSAPAESDADRLGRALAGPSTATLDLAPPSLAPAWRGDKQIAFSGMSMTVTDTYVLYGEAADAPFLARFQAALDRFYNVPSFTYRGYTVDFDLSVRMANYGPVAHYVPQIDDFVTTEGMQDSSSDPATSLFQVIRGSGDAGGFFTLTLYEGDDEGTIAHEVGHYLSDRVGIFSEGYSESFTSRLCAATGLCEREGSQVRPEAVMADGRVDIMASTHGTVTDFSLSGILDEAIDEHAASP